MDGTCTLDMIERVIAGFAGLQSDYSSFKLLTKEQSHGIAGAIRKELERGRTVAEVGTVESGSAEGR